MKSFVTFLLICLTTSCLQAQQSSSQRLQEALQFELDNLREQIVLIIQHNHESLVEMDDEVAHAKLRIQYLETQNKYLRDASKATRKDYRTRLANQLEKAHREIEGLQNENKDLRLLSKSNQTASRSNTREFIQRLREAEAERDRYATKSAQLEQDLAEKGSISKEALEEMERSMVELSRQKARLEIENRQLREHLEDNSAVVQLTVAEREKLMVANNRYRAASDSLMALNKSLRTFPQSYSVNVQQKRLIDSLNFEIKSLKNTVEVLNQNGNVQVNRARALESREDKVKETEVRLGIREQLIAERERDLAMGLKDLETKELRYQALEEKEKRLNLMEQRLRAMMKESENSK